MELEKNICTRRSIRRFLADPVPKNIIKEIIDKAKWCPSWGNTQPWEVTVVTGPALKQLQKENKETLLSGIEPDPDVPMPESWPDPLKKRYADVGKSVLNALSIKRNDEDGRQKHYASMFSFFDAPVLLMFTADRQLAVEYSFLDTGIFIQNISLLAHEKKLGTCILAASIHFPETVRRLCLIPEDKILVIGMALGYPDSHNPVNNFERERISVDDFVTWVE